MSLSWRERLSDSIPWRRLLATGLAAYALFAGALWHYADRLIFVPHAPGYRDDPRLVALPGPGGTRLTAAWLPVAGAAVTVLYSHGNAEDLGDVLPTLEALNALGLAVLAYDYPGYGTSEGTVSSAGAVAAIEAAYEHLVRVRQVPPERLIAHGRSIGGGPTLALAAHRPLGGLILESTFTSIRDVRFPIPLVPFDKFRSRDALATLSLPTLVIHGTVDALIPASHGRALYDTARGPKRHLWVEGAGHNDVQALAGPAWGRAIADFAASVAAQGRQAAR